MNCQQLLMGATAGRPLPVKKRGGVKPRKKETAVASKRGAKGNTRAAVPTSSPTVFREVVGEGGLPAGEGQRQDPAASIAHQAAAGAVAMETAGAVATEPAAGTDVPTPMAPQQGVYCHNNQSMRSAVLVSVVELASGVGASVVSVHVGHTSQNN